MGLSMMRGRTSFSIAMMVSNNIARSNVTAATGHLPAPSTCCCATVLDASWKRQTSETPAVKPTGA